MALHCIISILWEYGCTVEAYSSCGRTIVLYAVSRTPVCLVFDVSLIKPSDLLAFELILFICVLKFKLMDKSTPRYLAEDTLSRTDQELLMDFADLSEPVNLYLPTAIYSMPIEKHASSQLVFEAALVLSGIKINRNRLRSFRTLVPFLWQAPVSFFWKWPIVLTEQTVWTSGPRSGLAGHLLFPQKPTHPLSYLNLFFCNIKYFQVPNICIWTLVRVNYKSPPNERNCNQHFCSRFGLNS